MNVARAAIFDQGERTDATAALYNESTFHFLNRAATQYWEDQRQLIQSWANNIAPLDEYKDLRSRIRSGDNGQFNSAFLELYLHEWLLRARYTVSIHPEVQGTLRRPDFYAERNGQGFFLEAIAPGASTASIAAARRRAVVLDVVDRVQNPNFILWLDQLTVGSGPLATKALRTQLARWLDGLDPDSLDFESQEPFRWIRDGWIVTFLALPKKSEARGPSSDERAIGVLADSPAALIDDAPLIRAALETKTNAYGDLGAPYVIAVGIYIHDDQLFHSANALYGREVLQLSLTSDTTRSGRKADGYFGTMGRWRNRTVSGVLVVNQLMPHSIASAQITLWEHPDPQHPLHRGHALPGQIVSADGTVSPAANPLEHLALPEPWPHGEDDWSDQGA